MLKAASNFVLNHYLNVVQTPKPVDLNLSLDVLLALSPMLGHRMESREHVRAQQNLALLDELQSVSSIELIDPRYRKLFAVAPLDVLVEQSPFGKKFHVIELNGTGIGGLTNMPEPAVNAVAESIADVTHFLPRRKNIILVGSSGKESNENPRLNKLIYEKAIYVDAIVKRLRQDGKTVAVRTAEDFAHAQNVAADNIVVLGYLKEILQGITVEHGAICFHGHAVGMIVNDRLCVNLLANHAELAGFGDTMPVNATFLPGADKGVVYRLLNEFLQASPHPQAPARVHYDLAGSRDELLSIVQDRLGNGEKCLIKPRGTGLGHGIEFFLDADEKRESITRKIDGSIKLVTEYYGTAEDEVFPYTVCDFIDTATIDRVGHPLHGHKYELRVVVYRDEMSLKAFPSIIKASSMAYDASNCHPSMLINNITNSSQISKMDGTNFMLPLCNWQTLDLLDIDGEELAGLCKMAVGFVKYSLDQVISNPSHFMLSSDYCRY